MIRALRKWFPFRAVVRARNPYGAAAPVGKEFLFARWRAPDGSPARPSVKTFPIEVLAPEGSITRLYLFKTDEVDMIVVPKEQGAAA